MPGFRIGAQSHRVADVAVGVDQAGQQRLALDIDARRARGHRRRGRTDRGDLVARDHDRTVVNHLAGAVDDAAADERGRLGVCGQRRAEHESENRDDTHGR